MGLCGSSFCGCAVTSVPADFAEINGAYPSIDVAGNGTGASPWNLTLNDEWAGAVAAIRVTGYTERTTNFGGFAATPLTVMEVTWMADSTRAYMTTISGDVATAAANDVVVLSITDATNAALARWTDRLGSTSAVTYEKTIVESGLSGSVTRRLRASRASGSGVCDVVAASGRRAFMVVRDIGPAW